MSDNFSVTSECGRITICEGHTSFWITHSLSGMTRPIGDGVDMFTIEDDEPTGFRFVDVGTDEFYQCMREMMTSPFQVEEYVEAYFDGVSLPAHYIAKAGLKGCLPNYLEVAATLEDAVEVLWDVHPTIGRRRRAILKKELYLDLHLHPCFAIPDGDGNEYCQIVKCDCDTPWNHGSEDPASICEYLRGEWEYETT